MEKLIPLLLSAILVLLAMGLWRKLLKHAFIMPGEIGLLYGPQGFIRELAPGLHRWTNLFGGKRVFRVPAIPQALHGHVVEVISKDQFAFRVTLAPQVTVTDPRAFIEQTRAQPDQPGQAHNAVMSSIEYRFDRLGPTIAAAALETVSSLTLEEFIAGPQMALAPVAERVEAVLPGARLDTILVTAISLPPEIRKMFTEVERARREGLAGLERARAEQASLRALANAARNLNDNPALAQLRMLQVMENAKGAKTFMLGALPDDMPKKRE